MNKTSALFLLCASMVLAESKTPKASNTNTVPNAAVRMTQSIDSNWRLRLGDELAHEPFDIRYTTDGTEPTSTSPRYTIPLCVKTMTTVRSAVFLKSNLITASSGVFTQGLTQPPSTNDPATPRGEQGEAEDPLQRREQKKPIRP